MAATPVLLVGAKPGLNKAHGCIASDRRFTVVGQFEDHLAACSAPGRLAEPALILLVERASDRPLIDAIECLRLYYPQAQLVVLGDGAAKVPLGDYVQSGASGRLSLAMTQSALLRSLTSILGGGRLFVSGDGRHVVPADAWDRRQSLRRPTYMACEVDPGKGRPYVSGRIFEMSHAGAKLRVDAHVPLPAAFDLRIKQGLIRRCRIIRRSTGCYCVAFVDGLGGRSHADRPTTHMGT